MGQAVHPQAEVLVAQVVRVARAAPEEAAGGGGSPGSFRVGRFAPFAWNMLPTSITRMSICSTATCQTERA